MSTKHSKINNPHDNGYKHLLYSKKAFMELIKSFIKPGWAEQIDEASLVRIDKAFILQDFKNKEADVVYRARLKDRDVIFYVLLELQSQVDYLIPYRLLLYMTEVWRDFLKNRSKKDRERKSFRLPVIVPIVLYNHKGKWTVPLNFKETLAGSDLFGNQAINFKYLLINVHDYAEEDLLELSGLFGAVFLVDQAKDLEEIITRLKLLAETIKKLDPEEFELFTSWTENILTRNIQPEEKNEVVTILQETRPEEVEQMISNVERVLKKTYKDAEIKGIEQGIEKGIEQGILLVARQMLLEGEDVEKIIRYTGLSMEAIEQLQ
jgi:predicted transposase/invertase (TIGR01784 family)